MIRTVLLTWLSFLVSSAYSQGVLDQYVKQALEQNPGIKEKKLLEQKEIYTLNQAKRQFAPSLSFLTSYSLATGGRSIDLPIGTLLNDVYSTLNTLTGTQDFHLIENQSVQFLPHNYYDTRFRITQPILQPEIKYNKLIRQQEVNLAALTTNQAARELVREVKATYFQWMQAHDALDILDQGLALLQENKRVTESLVRNGSGIPSAVIRIDAEITSVEAQKQKTTADLANAASYFNFLLHRPTDTAIEADSFPSVPLVNEELDIMGREELQQIKTGNQLQQLALELEEKHFAPRLGLQVDVGSQEYVPDWGGYVFGGVQLEIPIWDNKQSKLRRQAWNASMASTEAKYEWTKGALETQLQSEIRNLEADLAMYHSYTASLISQQRYYQETTRRYREGLSNYIELLDARTQVTHTQLQQNISKYQAWIRRINIERLSATGPIQ